MGNTSLETAEKHRGENVIAKVLDQLIQALAIVGARAETKKAAVDTARIDAEVRVSLARLYALVVKVRTENSVQKCWRVELALSPIVLGGRTWGCVFLAGSGKCGHSRAKWVGWKMSCGILCRS